MNYRDLSHQVNYNDTNDGRDDSGWQDQGSDYNSDFSVPSDNDNDDEFDEKNEGKIKHYYFFFVKITQLNFLSIF